MLATEFLLLIIQNITLYVTILFLSASFNLIIFRNYTLSFIDPNFLYLIYSTFGTATVIFLFKIDLISNKYLVSYCATQLAFIIGVILIRPPAGLMENDTLSVSTPTQKKITVVRLDEAMVSLYLLSCLTTILGTLIGYYAGGVPLFAESRLGLYSDGTGIVSRFTQAASLVCLFFLFLRTSFRTSSASALKLIDFFMVVFFLITSILSGSKSSFLNLAFAYFFVHIFFRYHGLNPVGEIRFFGRGGVILMFAFFVVMLMGMMTESDSFIVGLVIRFVMSGDIYFMAYPNDVISQIPAHNWFLSIFQDSLGMLRIVPWDSLPGSLGGSLFKILDPLSAVGGPNSRHNVYGVFLFGVIGGCIYSFLLGVLLGVSRFFTLRLLRASPWHGLFYFLMAFACSSVEIDVALTLSLVNNIFLVVPAMMFAAIIIGRASRRKRIDF